MYEDFFQLKCKPFDLAPDPRFLYLTDQHARAVANVRFALMNQDSFVVITGEIGSGKTTLINFLLRKIQQDIHVGIVNNTNVLPLQFIKMICQEFELDVDHSDKA